MNDKHATTRRWAQWQSMCGTGQTLKRQIRELMSSDNAGLCLGAALCLLAVRRVRGLDFLLGAVGAGLAYRSLKRRQQRDDAARLSGLRGTGVACSKDAEATAAGGILMDNVDEASLESFPGSDPPAFTGTSASPAVAVECP